MSTSPSHPRATISDVAERAGVSIATVSRVINKTAVVADETSMRVQAAIAELNYVPQGAARSLAGGKNRAIGLLVPEISGHFFVPLLRGIEAAARDHDLDLVIHSTDRQPLSRPSAARPVGEHNTDGLLVFISSLEEGELTRLHSRNFPIVLLHQSPPAHINIPYVTFENKSGARRIVDHLIEVHGCHKIAFLQGPEGHEDSRWRETGYRQALEAHGIPFEPALVAVGGFSTAEASIAVHQWLIDEQEFDAIFSGDDDAAFGVIRTLQDSGLSVPQDVAVVGFDDVPFSQFSTPPLTTVHAPIETAGYEATRQLVRLIQTGQAEPKVLLPTELVIRQSCGCKPG